MSDPISLVLRPYKADSERLELLIKTSEVMVLGAYAAIDKVTGLVELADDTAGLIPCGVVVDQYVGDHDSLTGDGTVKAVCRSGIILESVAVTGASAITDIGSPVYATDGQTLSLTAPTAGMPFGVVTDWHSSTTCDVYAYKPWESMANAAEEETIYLGYVSAQSLGGTAAADLLKYTAPYRMQIDSLYAYPNIDDAATAGSAVCNLEIGTTNLTGGALTLNEAACDAIADLGTVVSATAITAANIANEGDVITLEAATGATAFTDNTVAGFNVYMDVTKLPGA